MQITSEQSYIALRAFLTLPSMPSSAPFGEHGDSLQTLKTIFEARYDDSELAHTQLQPTGQRYQE